MILQGKDREKCHTKQHLRLFCGLRNKLIDIRTSQSRYSIYPTTLTKWTPMNVKAPLIHNISIFLSPDDPSTYLQSTSQHNQLESNSLQNTKQHTIHHFTGYPIHFR